MKMKGLTLIITLLFSPFSYTPMVAQKETIKIKSDSSQILNDSINEATMDAYHAKLSKIEEQRISDSIKKSDLQLQLNSLKTTDNLQKEELLLQLQEIKNNEQKRIADKRIKIDLLRNNIHGYPALGILNDTIFVIYAKNGASRPKDRARIITAKIKNLYDDDYFNMDSMMIDKSEGSMDVMYGETILVSITEDDALWYGKDLPDMAIELKDKIIQSIAEGKKENSLIKFLMRSGLVLLVIGIVVVLVWLIRNGYHKLLIIVNENKDKWLKNLSYKDYTFLTADQELLVVLFVIKVLNWFIYALLIYVSLPIIFSIFPVSRDWADTLFQLVWSPFKNLIISVWNYLPNLFSILVIYFVMKYFISFVGYIFGEIQAEKLKINGFYPDWAIPTYSIVKFLLYAFMFVLIFPYLPGSDSNIFQGVSVFIGVLFSLGSSSAIANMVAGLVITYMRPFKIGDRIKIGDVTGDVIEKTMLVTRIRTPKNEEITIPNSSVLSGNTTNYSTYAKKEGLIVHTTITIGYDVPWPTVQKALLIAADRTEMLVKEPKPFVLQTSLDDFYVAYQINGYTKEANKMAGIYSDLHQNIQDACNELGIEILSPHYRAARDGNMSTIPASYLPKDYQAPSFSVKVEKG